MGCRVCLINLLLDNKLFLTLQYREAILIVFSSNTTDLKSAKSSIERVIIPTVSKLGNLAKHRSDLYLEGRFISNSSTIGCRPYNRPPVCVPSAIGTILSPTAAAEPDDEPPGVRRD